MVTRLDRTNMESKFHVEVYKADDGRIALRTVRQYDGERRVVKFDSCEINDLIVMLRYYQQLEVEGKGYV